MLRKEEKMPIAVTCGPASYECGITSVGKVNKSSCQPVVGEKRLREIEKASLSPCGLRRGCCLGIGIIWG